MHKRTLAARTLAFGAAVLLPAFVLASSHREAPAIAGMPRVDASDFYMFSSYETGRSAYVTLIANYVPLQDAYGGPNYFRSTPPRCTRSASTTTATPRRTSPSSSVSRTTTRTSRCPPGLAPTSWFR